jgi:glucokinase
MSSVGPAGQPGGIAVRLGFDVGGQSIKAVAVDDGGRVLGDARRETGREFSLDILVASLESIVEEFSEFAPLLDVVGVGVAGTVSATGTLRGAPNLPDLVGVSLAQALSERLGFRVVVENDANCAAVGEAWVGAGASLGSFLFVTLGTGLGSGLILDGRLYRGTSGAGPELGHMIVCRNGRHCGCGNQGCLEAYVSDVAVSTLAADSGGPLLARLQELIDGGMGAAQALFQAESEGLPQAVTAAGEWIDVLGVGIASAVNCFDVSDVVIGGGIAPAVLERRERLFLGLGSAIFARESDEVRIVLSSCGPIAGALGAARLAGLAASIGS